MAEPLDPPLEGPAEVVPGEPMAAAPSDYPRVDALFAGEPPPPPRQAGPQIRRLRRVLILAIPLDVLGIFCWTGVPGAALTLYAYLSADAEMARVELGEYPPEEAAVLARLRGISTFFLYFSVASFLVQAVLFHQGVYMTYIDLLVGILVRFWQTVVEPLLGSSP